jgi:hypothetical protein
MAKDNSGAAITPSQDPSNPPLPPRDPPPGVSFQQSGDSRFDEAQGETKGQPAEKIIGAEGDSSGHCDDATNCSGRYPRGRTGTASPSTPVANSEKSPASTHCSAAANTSAGCRVLVS